MTDDQAERIIVLLTEIRDAQHALVGLCTPEEPDDATPPPKCTHPREARSDQRLSATFWKCNDCGHVHDSEREATNATVSQ